MTMEHGIPEDELRQMEENVAKTGSTTRRFKIRAYMPVDDYIRGYIEVEALNKEEALKQAQDILDDDTENFDWEERIYPGNYDTKNVSINGEAEEVNVLGEDKKND
jgi:hypothetical protein